MVNFCRLRFFLLLAISSIFYGCFTHSKSMQCLDSIIKQNKSSALYGLVENSLIDTLNNWSAKNAPLTLQYKIDLWKVDAIIFNKTQDKCFIVILDIDTNKKSTINFINFGVGELRNFNQWYFYIAGMPNIAVSKKNGMSFSTLSEIAKDELIKGGVLDKCSLNDDYILNWFNDNLYNSHLRFLKVKAN